MNYSLSDLAGLQAGYQGADNDTATSWLNTLLASGTVTLVGPAGTETVPLQLVVMAYEQDPATFVNDSDSPGNAPYAVANLYQEAAGIPNLYNSYLTRYAGSDIPAGASAQLPISIQQWLAGIVLLGLHINDLASGVVEEPPSTILNALTAAGITVPAPVAATSTSAAGSTSPDFTSLTWWGNFLKSKKGLTIMVAVLALGVILRGRD